MLRLMERVIFLNFPTKQNASLLARAVKPKDIHAADFLLVAGMNLVTLFVVLI